MEPPFPASQLGSEVVSDEGSDLHPLYGICIRWYVIHIPQTYMFIYIYELKQINQM